MNIRGVDVRVAVRLPRGLEAGGIVISGQAPLRQRKAANVAVWPLDEERPAGPSALRAAYACVLERCSVGKGGTVVLPFYAAGLELSAAARIAAQEIFRFIRAPGQSRLPGTIVLWVAGVRGASRVRKIVEGYLGHIRNVLAWGPFVTVDTIIEAGAGVVLIRRKNPPFGWALREDSSITERASRRLRRARPPKRRGFVSITCGRCIRIRPRAATHASRP